MMILQRFSASTVGGSLLTHGAYKKHIITYRRRASALVHCEFFYSTSPLFTDNYCLPPLRRLTFVNIGANHQLWHSVFLLTPLHRWSLTTIVSRLYAWDECK
ncbi:hypothetical protein J6590_104131 [Homalodisca vitripennis]|nr:hypothetical protein J6590_104131 [Homalodisca vitripennis]